MRYRSALSASVFVLALAALVGLPSGAQANDASVPNCGAHFPSYVFYDDMESQNAANWVKTVALGTQSWTYPATVSVGSGTTGLHSSNPSTAVDARISPATTIAIPAAGNTFLRIKHSFAFEFDGAGAYDGGVVEYSTDGGATWADVDATAYNGTILSYVGDTNPLKGRSAFVKNSGGAIQSTFAVPAGAAGSDLSLRFRVGADSSGAGSGWDIDDVGVYQCAPDATAPETTISGGPSGPTTETAPTFTFASNELGSSLECKIDAGSFTRCFSGRSLGTFTDGPHTLSVRAIDPADNVDATPATRSFTVDTTPPETTIDSGPTGSTGDATPTFTFSSNESSTFECQTDAGAFAPCTSPATLSTLSDGAHTFSVRATDAAGQTDATAASTTFTVDTDAPQTTIDSGPAGGTTTADSTPTFGFAASEASTFQCRVDATSFAACTSPATLSALNDGVHTFSVRAVDAAGNVDQTPATVSFTVDTKPAPTPTPTPTPMPTATPTPTTVAPPPVVAVPPPSSSAPVPLPTPTLELDQKLTVSRTKVRVTVSTPGSGTVRARLWRGERLLASARVSAKSARTKRLSIRLNSATRRSLRRRSMKVRLTVAFTPAGGDRGTFVERTLTLKRKK